MPVAPVVQRLDKYTNPPANYLGRVYLHHSVNVTAIIMSGDAASKIGNLFFDPIYTFTANKNRGCLAPAKELRKPANPKARFLSFALTHD